MQHARAALAALAFALPVAGHAADGERMTITGEVIDTWCYFSGVMGGPDAVVGSAHHTCALWCSAGGIPVGLLDGDGNVYMILGIGDGDNDATNGGATLFDLASHTLTVEGTVYRRDGLAYLTIDEIVEDSDIVNPTHEDYGVVPPFAIPEDAQ